MVSSDITLETDFVNVDVRTAFTSYEPVSRKGNLGTVGAYLKEEHD